MATMECTCLQFIAAEQSSEQRGAHHTQAMKTQQTGRVVYLWYLTAQCTGEDTGTFNLCIKGKQFQGMKQVYCHALGENL
jgi:hypothetical protein